MTSQTWRCGHPRTLENTKSSPSTKPHCRTCHKRRIERYRVANHSGQSRGRQRGVEDVTPIGITDSDLTFRQMVRMGSAALLARTLRYLSNGGKI